MDVYVYVGVALLCVFLLKYFCLPSRKPSLPTVLLLGPKESGKTCLLSLLDGKSMPTTVQSLHGDSVLLSGNLKVQDIPGHQLTLKSTLDQAAQARAVVFLVDASDKESFRTAADGLYPLLANKVTPRILVFCNKQDKPGAKKLIMVESELSTAM